MYMFGQVNQISNEILAMDIPSASASNSLNVIK